ncbi:unnamed protein product [Musa acuminata subsp. malaccensis]|nr:unnamed protein product [Musa acuminata subsp. malaccensis]
MADFRLCSTSRSHSQAGLYHYAHELNQRLSLPSHTSVTLLGGIRPRKTTHLTVSRHLRMIGAKVRHPLTKEWYFRIGRCVSPPPT